jgi:hypothetical protein
MRIRRWLPVLLLTLAALACQTMLGGTPTAAAPYHGAFDCYGAEGGQGAYAGRVTINADGTALFRDYDDQTQTGTWTSGPTSGTLTFGGTALGSALYDTGSDTLDVSLAPGASVVHAEGGSMACQRAVPGITGPP